jgi:phosphate transport system substrate-binding protein
MKSFFLCSLLSFTFSSLSLSAETIKVGGTGAAMGTIRVLSAAFQSAHPGIKVEVVLGLGSNGAKKALLQDALQIAVTSKAGNDSEALQGAVATEYGKTPFVFASARDNSVPGLTTSDIFYIYSGKTNTWPDGKRLRLVLRPETDSDSEMLQSMSPDMKSAIKKALSREGIRMAVTDQDSADAIETIPGALGTSTLALILSEKRSLKVLTLDQVTPNCKTIADGTYRYFKSFYLIRKPTSEMSEKFVSFVLSSEGQKILSGLGHWGVQSQLGR